MKKKYEGTVAVVTGGATGIGRAIVKELAGYGCSVMIGYYTNAEEARDLQASLKKAGVKAAIQRCDISHYGQARQLIKKTLSTFGRVDVLVNNAGITRDRTVGNMTAADWKRVLSVNLDGAFYLTKEALPVMKKQNGGRIINIASAIAQLGAFGQANYAASKAGLIGLTRSCALEFAKYNIWVNAVCPGYVETQMLQDVPAEVRASLIKKIPMSRFGNAKEVALAVRFLALEAEYMTGQCLNINGGLFRG